MDAPLGKVLVVDDEREFLDTLADYLEGQGYAVARAAGGDEALACVRRDPPDAVLLDIRMPGVNGLEVLRRLRRDRPAVPVVMLTGVDDEALARSALQIGALDYVRKPFDPDQLNRVVLAAIGRASGGRG
ncbi:MAG: response regulator [Candidatus Rokubacteria bacterium]|nr:response regulator [Candidatus Rokubacteria bacterium]